MFASFAHIDNIDIAGGCLLHLQQAVTVSRYVTSVNNEDPACGIELVAWVLDGPCSDIGTVSCGGKIMYLCGGKVIVSR